MHTHTHTHTHTDLEKSQHTTDSQDTENPHQPEDSRREFGVGLRDAQLDDDINQGNPQDDQVKQVPLAEKIVFPQPYYLGSKVTM